jgi:hypothetical protein
MPFVSAAQRGWAHTPAGMRALGGPAKVAEWDRASKGLKLPEHTKPQGYPGNPGGPVAIPGVDERDTSTIKTQLKASPYGDDVDERGDTARDRRAERPASRKPHPRPGLDYGRMVGHARRF